MQPKQVPWTSLIVAAQHLGEPPRTLRKRLERAAIKGEDGVVSATTDGVEGRKLGRVWKVRLAPGWL